MSTNNDPQLKRYIEACNYPGVLDEVRVEQHLSAYLRALGMQRQVVRIQPGWEPEDYPDLVEYGHDLLDDIAKRNPEFASDARDARVARDASDASDARVASDGAMKRFLSWCVFHSNWWSWVWDLSWVSTTYIGSLQTGSAVVQAWAGPLFEAFASGAWTIHFTAKCLYWVAKPVVHVDRSNGGRRLHHDTGPTLECDLENLYFIRGVMVPAFVVVRPDWITVEDIDSERNSEVRRIMLERFGVARYVKESGSQCVNECPDDHQIVGLRTAKLYRKELPGDEPIVMLDMLNSTPEPDGTTKRYKIRVDPNAYEGAAAKECLAAMASTYRYQDGSMVFATPQDYRPIQES